MEEPVEQSTPPAERCELCKFARNRAYAIPPPQPQPPGYVQPPDKLVLECRYSDPFAAGQGGYWPVVKFDDWCGKYVAGGP